MIALIIINLFLMNSAKQSTIDLSEQELNPKDIETNNPSTQDKDNKLYINSSNCKVWVKEKFLNPEESQMFFDHCKTKLNLSQHELTFLGKKLKQPRLSCSLGKDYAYTGSIQRAVPFDELSQGLMDRVNKCLSTNFNSALVNYYRDGNDYISSHSDNTKSLSNGIVAGISLGTDRTMVMTNKKNPKLKKKFTLSNGSLFIMEGDTQIHWKHGIPKEKKTKGERISFTFREFKD